MVDRDASLEYLLSERHAELDVYVLTMQPVGAGKPDDPDEAAELFRRHLLYWWELEEAGILVAAGPIEVGTPDQHGMALLVAPSRAEAERLAHAEPFHVAGHRRNTVHHWQLNEGPAVELVREMIA